MSRLISMLAALVMLVGTLSFAPAGSYAQTTRTFPETGHTVKGKFLQYWNSHGALAQQGYPISEEIQEQSSTDGKTYTMQYFERAVFELHPEFAGTNSEVLLSLLGVLFYKAKYGEDAPGQTASTDNPRPFDETGFTVGGAFRTYWEAHGGLAQQGYPISDEFEERNDTDGKRYSVQYFERAVFEYHPENAGTPSEVLLSLLGVFTYNRKYGGGNGDNPLSDLTVSNWSHVVAATNNVAFFYNSGNGNAVTVKVGADGSLLPLQKYPNTTQGNKGIGAGWTHIVACPNNILFFYGANDGLAAIASVDNEGRIHQIGTQQLAPGWQTLNCDQAGGMMFYKTSTTLDAIIVAKITPDGAYSEVKSYRDTAPLGSVWTHFVPVSDRIWFWYMPAASRGDITSVNADGTFTTLHSYNTFGHGWQSIVSDGTNMVFYDKTNGVIVTAQLGLANAFQALKTYNDIEKVWTNLAATPNHVFIFYASASGRIATDTVNNDGSETALKRYYQERPTKR